MKLRVKLTLLAVLVVTVAVVVCVWLIIAYSRQNAMDSVIDSCTSDYQKFLNEYLDASREVGNRTSLAKNSYLVYQFRNITGSDEYVLQTDDAILSNNTGIDAKKGISQGGTTEYLLEYTGNSAQYKTANTNGESYFIIGSSIVIDSETYFIALVRNITDTIASMTALAVKCMVTAAVVIVLAALLMSFVICRSLNPVKKLELGASALAQGQYESRIEIKGKDELAALADSFNKMADAIELHISEVEATSEERRMLLSALSHEMRTPVTAITGYSHALMHAMLTDEQKREAVFFIDSECRRLERLSGKLMQLISLQGHDLVLSELSADALFNELRAILVPIADKENVSLVFENRHGILQAERDLIICLLINLFDNARKAGAKNITISAEKRVISVADDGKGIPLEHMAKITQPFYTVDQARHAGNFGLGLSLCKRIAELHYAELVIKSEMSVGTVVQLKF